jgi:uncharacterized protein (DUF39 family)
LCGAQGYVTWNGTQFNTSKEQNINGIPTSNARTLAVMGNLKEMTSQYLRAAYFEKYGVSMFIGIGIPIPILDNDMAHRVSIRNSQIETTICDYGHDYDVLGKIDYESLRSGEIEIRGKKVHTSPLSSLAKAREIANLLKCWIERGEFTLTAPVRNMPTGTSLNNLDEKLF